MNTIRVLEIAHGTGYWTQFIASTAREVIAIDVAPEPLNIARKRIPDERVQFIIGDAYRIPLGPRTLNAAFAGFWLSMALQVKSAVCSAVSMGGD